MSTPSEERAAALAVARYGADRDAVQAALHAVHQSQSKGQRAELLDMMVFQELLTPNQADELKHSLETTNLDANAVPRNGTSKKRGHDAAGDPFTELKQLGEYRLLRRLGEGGMGSVYLGYHAGANVAIKVLPDQLASNQSYIDRFYREARSGLLLNHTNIVRFIHVQQDVATSKHYLVMEYVDGPSAHTLLNRHGLLSVGDAVRIALDIARALEHAHSRNIVHRDIKPDNILLTRTGVAKLADLGLAKRTDEASHLTAARQGFGTPHYMPYEQAVSARHADGRSDIYALGATLYHLVTGELPFNGDNHLEVVEKKNLGAYTPANVVNAAIPDLLSEILDKMLARDPRDRYQTASELIIDLQRSRLAAPVPSFADLDEALQDPAVRARLTHPSQATRPDMGMVPDGHRSNEAAAEVWILRFRNRDGHWAKARATTRQLIQRLRAGRLPRGAEVCRPAQHGFQPLAEVAEFRSYLKNGQPLRRADAGGHHRKTIAVKMEKKDAKRPASSSSGNAVRRDRWSFYVGLGVALVLVLVSLVVVFELFVKGAS
jgi:serine/threonine protein kinase